MTIEECIKACKDQSDVYLVDFLKNSVTRCKIIRITKNEYYDIDSIQKEHIVIINPDTILLSSLNEKQLTTNSGIPFTILHLSRLEANEQLLKVNGNIA